MKIKLSLLIILLAGWSAGLICQVVTTEPVFPIASGQVEVTFHADKGDMGLKDYAGDDVYAHTGVITDQSTGLSDWKYVVAPWTPTAPPDKVKLKKVSDNVYTLTISPSIRGFYGVPAGEKILKLAFVFRNSTGSRTGRDVGGGDIFYNVSEEPSFQVMISQPDRYTSVVASGQVIPVQASASVCDSLVLYSNGTRIKKVTETTLTQDIMATGSGTFRLVALAWYQSVAKADSVYYFIRTAPAVAEVPAGLRPGVNITGDNSATFLLFAPGKSNVFVMGDFNNWVFCDDGFMNKSPDGNWYWLEVTGLDPAVEYGFQYVIDESIRVCDPYSTKIIDPWNDGYITAETYPDLKPYPAGFAENLVSVFQTHPPHYAWKNNSFTPPVKNNMIIYELLVRDFVAAHDFNTIRDTLSYLKRLGVNAIEFMPVTEFDGNLSWGYNPAMYFAVDKYYGPSDTFKELIDSCHSKGIAVIMDMVLNHAYGNNPLVRMYFNSSTSKPASDNPWFNVESPNPYISFGYDFNHESSATKAFVDSVCHYWIDEFRVDGFRFDFTKGFTNTSGDGNAYDASRIALLERMGNKIWSYKPDAVLILEHFADNTEEKELSSFGFLLWGDGKYGYRNASMGKSSDNSFRQASWKNLGWDVPGLVDYMESHDEERLMFLNTTSGEAVAGYNIRDFNTAVKRIKLAAAFFMTIPGTKMLWQFEELGYDYSIDYNTRLGEKPIKWDYENDPVRMNLFNNFAALTELKKSNPAFSSNDFTLYESGMTKRLNIQSSDMDVVVLGNFSLFPETIDPNFTKTGTWYEFFSGYARDVSAGSQNTPISLLQGEYRLFTTRQLARPSFLLAVDDQPADGADGVLFEAWPNPFSEGFVIMFTGTDEYQPHTVEIFSAGGSRVRMMVVPAGISDINVDGVSLAAGIYYVKITVGRVSQVRKIIKV